MRFLKMLLLAALIVSCNNSNEPVIPKEDVPLMPLKIGNHWTYLGYYLTEDGTVDYPEYLENYAFGYKISDTLSINIEGKKYCTYKLAQYDPQTNYVSSDAKLIYNNALSLYYAGNFKANKVSLTFNDMVFKYPVKKNDSYKAHTFYYNTYGNYLRIPDTLTTDYVCVSIDSLFTTPIGEFKCVVYKTRLMLDDIFYLGDLYSFYKPGIGLIGTILMNYSYITQSHHYFLKEVLINYKLN